MPATNPGTGLSLDHVHSRTDKNQQKPQEKCQYDIPRPFQCHLNITAIEITKGHLLITPQLLVKLDPWEQH